MCWVFVGVDPPVAHLSISGMILVSAVSHKRWQGASHLHELVLMYLLFQLVAAPCEGGMTRTDFLLPNDIALLRVTPLTFAADSSKATSLALL